LLHESGRDATRCDQSSRFWEVIGRLCIGDERRGADIHDGGCERGLFGAAGWGASGSARRSLKKKSGGGSGEGCEVDRGCLLSPMGTAFRLAGCEGRPDGQGELQAEFSVRLITRISGAAGIGESVGVGAARRTRVAREV